MRVLRKKSHSRTSQEKRKWKRNTLLLQSEGINENVTLKKTENRSLLHFRSGRLGKFKGLFFIAHPQLSACRHPVGLFFRTKACLQSKLPPSQQHLHRATALLEEREREKKEKILTYANQDEVRRELARDCIQFGEIDLRTFIRSELEALQFFFNISTT